jgi:hypothetical protein
MQHSLVSRGGQETFFKDSKLQISQIFGLLPLSRFCKFHRCACLQIKNLKIFIINPKFLQNPGQLSKHSLYFYFVEILIRALNAFPVRRKSMNLWACGSLSLQKSLGTSRNSTKYRIANHKKI